ncbi:hypothetical protein [Xanthomonas cerealis]|uniref:hypothetical protein n=1 Tax=Xanthomonas cerealis TaxID=3390025 RepID=UPI00114CD3BA|nr:hypothetical protein [Xanthomonas translucens]UKE45805.1 hypothetical protein KHA79_11485 [Xanthomonas translucens pv. cerealis]
MSPVIVFAAMRRAGLLGRAAAVSAIFARAGSATAFFGLACFAAAVRRTGGTRPACTAASVGFGAAADAAAAARFCAGPPVRARCCLVAIAVLHAWEDPSAHAGSGGAE